MCAHKLIEFKCKRVHGLRGTQKLPLYSELTSKMKCLDEYKTYPVTYFSPLERLLNRLMHIQQDIGNGFQNVLL